MTARAELKDSDRDLRHRKDICAGDERVGSTLKRAYANAATWIGENQRIGGTVGTMP